jgi:hypothetical protein
MRSIAKWVLPVLVGPKIAATRPFAWERNAPAAERLGVILERRSGFSRPSATGAAKNLCGLPCGRGCGGTFTALESQSRPQGGETMLIRVFLFVIFTIALFFVKVAHAEPSATLFASVFSADGLLERTGR